MCPSVGDTLSLPITQAGRQQAQAFQQQQSWPQKAEQVYWNTLAVWVVKDYLDLMQIPSDLAAGDSWSPLMQAAANVADLVIPGVGILECRPAFAPETVCYVPPEVWSERIGYLVVLFGPDQRQAQLLGFTPAVSTSQIRLKDLQPLDALLVHLSELLTVSTSQPTSKANGAATYTDLSQWCQGVFTNGWQTLESLVQKPASALAYNFRSLLTLSASSLNHQIVALKRAKIVGFGHPQPGLSLVLTLNVLETADEDSQELCVQAFPLQEAQRLPADVYLAVLDDQQSIFREAQSREIDNYLQLQFSGQSGEHFYLLLKYQDQEVIEEFVI